MCGGELSEGYDALILLSDPRCDAASCLRYTLTISPLIDAYETYCSSVNQVLQLSLSAEMNYQDMITNASMLTTSYKDALCPSIVLQLLKLLCFM